MRFSRVNNQAGMALIVVLWLLVVMTIMALTLSQTVRTEVMLTSHYHNQAKATALAEAGIWRASTLVLNRAIAASYGTEVSLAGSVYKLESDIGELHISLQSCSGLIDLNRAPPELIKSLLLNNIPSTDTVDIILDSLLDWRDEDDLRRLNGAESDDYRAQGVPYGPKNGLMNSVSELARVNGVSPAIYDALAPWLTIYSGQPRVNINNAPAGVIRALPAINNAILQALSGTNKQLDVNLLSAETRKYIGAGQNEYIKISSFAKVNNSVSGIIAIVKLELTPRSPVTVMSWKHGIDTVFMNKQ